MGNEHRPKCSMARSKARLAHSICRQTCGWAAGKTVIPLTSAILSALEMTFIIKRYTNLQIYVIPFYHFTSIIHSFVSVPLLSTSAVFTSTFHPSILFLVFHYYISRRPKTCTLLKPPQLNTTTCFFVANVSKNFDERPHRTSCR